MCKDAVGEDKFERLLSDAHTRAMKHFNEIVNPESGGSDDVEEQYITFPKAGLKNNPSKTLLNDALAMKRHSTAQGVCLQN
jgi:hypothetical protein